MTAVNMNSMFPMILQALMGGQLSGASQDPKTETMVNSLKSIAGKDKKTSEAEIEKQLSVFDTQLSTLQVFAAIPQFATYISPMLANINAQKNALELVYDNFEAFAGNDGLIDKYERGDIEDYAETDDNAATFSDEDLEEMYDDKGIPYEEEVDFSYSNYDFDEKINNSDETSTDNDTYNIDDEYEDQNVLIKDSTGDDRYDVAEGLEDSTIIFTKLNEGDLVYFNGDEWSDGEVVYDENDDDQAYVRYHNNEGTNVYIKGELDEVKSLTFVRRERG